MPIGSIGTNFIKIQNFSFTKMHLKISSAKWRPFCPGGDKLMPAKWKPCCSGLNTSAAYHVNIHPSWIWHTGSSRETPIHRWVRPILREGALGNARGTYELSVLSHGEPSWLPTRPDVSSGNRTSNGCVQETTPTWWSHGSTVEVWEWINNSSHTLLVMW